MAAAAVTLDLRTPSISASASWLNWISSAHLSADSNKTRLKRLTRSCRGIAGGYLLHMGHHAHVVVVDAFLELCALVEAAAAEDRSGHSQRRSGQLHPRR